MVSGLDTALARISTIRSTVGERTSRAPLDVGFDSILARQAEDPTSAGNVSLPAAATNAQGTPGAAWARASTVLAALAEGAASASPAAVMPGSSKLPTAAVSNPEWIEAFQAATERYGLPQGLLQAVAQVESGFNPNAVSPAGAQGLMQFMPATAADLGVDPFDPQSAIDGAARYLSSHLERFGSIEHALAAYNAGPGAVQRYGGVPPFAETEQYVTKVLAAWGSAA